MKSAKQKTSLSIISPEPKDISLANHTLKVGVLASGFGSNFEALVRSVKSGMLNAEIPLIIVNNANCGAIEKAKQYNIPYKLLDHRRFNSREELDLSIAKEFYNYKIEAIVMAGWMRIATPTLIDKYPGRIVNIHPSLLPSFKGKDAIKQALEEGVKITGCTVHLVQNDVDSGPILIQAAVIIEENETYNSLKRKIQIKEHEILPIGLILAARNWRSQLKDNK